MTESEMVGQIFSIYLDKKILLLKDVSGIIHPYKWSTPAQEELMVKQKAWEGKGFMSVKADGEVIKSAHYMKRPDNWPQPQKPVWTGQKSDTRMIAAQVLLKAYVDLWINTNTPDQVLFNDAREDIRKAVEEDLVWLMKIGGV